MKLHELKLLENYAKAKKDGIKPFEIRKNDRDFKVGDLVKYNIVESYTEPYPPSRTLTRESQNEELTSYFANRIFKIKYITNYEQKDGYVVFVDEGYYIGNMSIEKRLKDLIEFVKCPETGSAHYGRWGILNREQRVYLDKLARDCLLLMDKRAELTKEIINKVDDMTGGKMIAQALREMYLDEESTAINENLKEFLL